MSGVDTYPCPACGGVADETTGCRSCGRPHDPDAAALAKLNQRLAGLDRDLRHPTDENQSELLAERARLQAEADSLRAALVRRLTLEASAKAPTRVKEGPLPIQETIRRGPSLTIAEPAAVDDGSTRPPRQRPPAEPTSQDVPETSPRSAQNTLLTLGGVLLGIAAIVVTLLFYTSTAKGGRALVLGAATLIALSVPLLLTRRTLTATAETIAGFGLLAVLLDGYAAYFSGFAGLGSVPFNLFSAVLFGLVAAIAAAYRLASHLRAPQFAALLAVQPFLPLVAAHLRLDRNGFGAVFAVVAALNLASVELLSRDIGRAIARVRLPGAAPGPGGQAWPRRLRELAWVLFGATLAIAVGLVVYGLATASTVDEAVRSALVLLLVAAVGLVGARMSGRSELAHLAGGAAALAIIASVSRVNALALPDYTLVLTAAVCAAIALASGLLPESSRIGPRLGSLLGALLTAAVVLASVAKTIVATIRASITPAVWSADLASFADRVHTANWQYPAAAVLLAILAVAAVPATSRLDAVIAGTAVVTFALPATGALSWWAVPMLAWAVSTVATATSLASGTGQSALIRSGSAGLLGLFAIATSLARPGLTTVVCTLLALVSAAAAIIAAGWPDRFGPYADRVGDSATGSAAFTLPIAVGTGAWLAGAPGSVVVPLTVFSVAIGVFGAALAQVAAQSPRTGGAGGALAAAAGAVLLALRAEGAAPADVGLAVVLFTAATVSVAARAFEVARVVDEGLAGDAKRRRVSPVDTRSAGAALATAGLILAMARLGAVGVPGIGLVTTTAMVLVVSLGVLLLPRSLRVGPRIGAVAVGGGIAVVTAGIAVIEAARALGASTPYWSADLAGWSARVSSFAPYGWQVPVSLLLAAVAAVALLPRPTGGDIGFVTLCLAALSTPAVAASAWWTPPVIAGGLAFVAGVGAALIGPNDPPGTHQRRLGLAFVLGLYATAAAGATSASTGIVLSGIIAAGVLVAATARLRRNAPDSVAGVATAAALAAAPGAAATLSVAGGASRTGVLTSALAVATLGVGIVALLRVAGVRWGAYPAFGVGIAALIVAGAAAVPDPADAAIWAAAAALVATAASALSRSTPSDARVVTAAVVTTAVPPALLAAVVTTPAWLTALIGPYRTLRQVWAGYAVTPEPRGATTAMITLVLLSGVCAGIALAVGGRRYVLAAILPPIAAASLVLPSAIGASREVVPWVVLAVALATGLGAALSPPTLPSAATLLRGTAGVVCALTGGAGLAGSLATRGATLAALAVVAGGALVAALLGRDPAVRMVAWIVFSAAGFALPPTWLAANGRELRPAAFAILALCALLVGLAWTLARSPNRRPDAAIVELCSMLGAAFALLLALGSARYTAAVLTICGLLLGAAALRRDRPARRRHWLVRAALATELGACWVLLYDVQVGLTEAYTLPFAAVALLTGALELRRRRELSSWVAYGPALAGGFLPSVALILVGANPPWRWVSVFLVAVGAVIIGSWRGRQAPVVTGATVAVVVAITEMIYLLLDEKIFGALLVGLAGVVLIVFGALAERRLRGARRLS